MTAQPKANRREFPTQGEEIAVRLRARANKFSGPAREAGRLRGMKLIDDLAAAAAKRRFFKTPR